MRCVCVCVCVCVQNGWSCLHVASHKGHVDVVKYLCAQGGEKLLMLTSDVSVCFCMGMQVRFQTCIFRGVCCMDVTMSRVVVRAGARDIK